LSNGRPTLPKFRGEQMKKTILALLVSVSAFANAQSADQIYTVFTCQRKVAIPDLGLSVTVREGGIAGMTQVQVRRFFLGHDSQTNYYVQQELVKQGVVGAPMVFDGNGIRLTANFTTAPVNGQHPGLLEIQDESGKFSSEELVCKLTEQK